MFNFAFLQTIEEILLDLRQILLSKVTIAVNKSLQQWNTDCLLHSTHLSIKKVEDHCLCSYKMEVGKLLYKIGMTTLSTKYSPLSGINAKSYIVGVLSNIVMMLQVPFDSTASLFSKYAQMSSISEFEPFNFMNLIYQKNVTDFLLYNGDPLEAGTTYEDILDWGVITSSKGSIRGNCTRCQSIPTTPQEVKIVLFQFIFYKLVVANIDIVTCTNSNSDSPVEPLSWKESSVYLDTSCLCVLSNRSDCGVLPPRGVDTQFYCISVLLKDLQKHVTYRPAVTYLDYSFKKRVPLCSAQNTMFFKYYPLCKPLIGLSFALKHNQCFFDGLVNKPLNCSHKQQLDTYNETTICELLYFTSLFACQFHYKSDAILFYGPVLSAVPLLFALTDLCTRVVTVAIYLSFKDLRNLPGKFFIAYQLTAIANIILVKCLLLYLQLVEKRIIVYIDIYLDLSSTFWLNAMTHFLYTSMKTLILPNDLPPYMACSILTRYSLYAWISPAILCSAFFSIDSHLDSKIEYGQLGFMISTIVILLSNIVMFVLNVQIVYDIKKNVQCISKSTITRNHYMIIFKFGVKTFILSGAGIIFRVIFSQVENFEYALNIFYFLGPIQGVLILAMYGYNESVSTWLRNKRMVKQSIHKENRNV